MRLLKFLLCLVVSFSLVSFIGCKKTDSELDGTTDKDGQSTIKYSEGLEFVLTSDGTAYEIASIGECEDREIVIPAVYQNKPIIAVKSYAFYNNLQIETLTISENVKVIESYAFTGATNLRSVMYLNSSTLERVEEYAFSGCTAMQFFNFSSSVKFVGEYAFSYCSALNSVTFNHGSQLETISAYAFKDCYILTGMRIPQTVKNIHATAFEGCKNLITSK